MKLKNNKIGYVIDFLCLAILIGITMYLILNWGNLPDQIPAHYDGAGNIDRWGKKGEILIVPIMGWILFIMISVLERFPALWNTGVKVTAVNAVRVYRTLLYMIKTLKLIVVADFAFLTITAALGKALPAWFTVAILVLVFGDIIFWLVRLSRVK